MWDDVRRQLNNLHWEDPAPAADLAAEWTTTVRALLDLRAQVGPIGADDPFRVLATTTRGLSNTQRGSEPLPGHDLSRLRQALAGVTPDEADQGRLTQAAHELTHWMRLQTPTNSPARFWLLTAETAFDEALHAPTSTSPTRTHLATWQEALSRVTANNDVARRATSTAHIKILAATEQLLLDADRTGTLPPAFITSLRSAIVTMKAAHVAHLETLQSASLNPSKTDAAVMLALGTSAKLVTTRLPVEPPRDQLAALIRSGIGSSQAVAALINGPAARQAARKIERHALEYVANSTMHRDVPPSTPTRAAATPAPPDLRPIRPPAPPATIAPGTILERDAVNALCRDRDRGAAALQGDPGHPLLAGVHPDTWPDIIEQGEQAISDLVSAVRPLLGHIIKTHPAQVGRSPEDAEGHLAVQLVRAARTYDPANAGGASWATCAATTMDLALRRGIDNAGVPITKAKQPYLSDVGMPLSLDRAREHGREPSSPDPIEQAHRVGQLRETIAALPEQQRAAITLYLDGTPLTEIGPQFGVSHATGRRRVTQAQEAIKAAIQEQDPGLRARRQLRDLSDRTKGDASRGPDESSGPTRRADPSR